MQRYVRSTKAERAAKSRRSAYNVVVRFSDNVDKPNLLHAPGSIRGYALFSMGYVRGLDPFYRVFKSRRMGLTVCVHQRL